MRGSTPQHRHASTAVPCRRAALLALLLLAPAAALAVEPAPAHAAWIPEGLQPWRRGLEMLHEGHGDSALREFRSLRAMRPTDLCGFYFPALAYGTFDVGGLEEEARRERSRMLMTEGIATGEAERKKRRDDLSFRYCLGALYGLQARDRLERSQYLRAAFDAKHSRRIMLDLLADAPRFQDCRFWTGSYDYFAAVLPSALKFFRALLFIPAGDRQRGLEAVEETTRRGNLERFTSYLVLQAAHGRFEKDSERSRDVMERFHRSFPSSPQVTLDLAQDLSGGNAGDRARAILMLKKLRGQIREGRLEGGQRLVDRVIVRLSQAFLADLNPWPIISELRSVVERAAGDRPRERQAVSVLVPMLNLTGQHGDAVQAAIAAWGRYPGEAWTDELVITAQLHDEESSRAERLLLPARRMGAGGALEAAEAEYRSVMRRLEEKGVAHFRMAETWFQAGRDPEAMASYRAVIELSEPFPRFAVSRSYLRVGNLLDLQGDRDGAREHYRLALKHDRKVPGIATDAKRWLELPFGPEEERR